MKKSALLFILSAGCILAQPAAPTSTVGADPSGDCVAHVSEQFNERNGKLWACVDTDGNGYGTWTWINQSSTGSGTIAATTNVIKGDGAGAGVAAIPGTDYVIPAGNTATATALAADGANCSAGQAPLGVDTLGAAQGCFAPLLPANNLSDVVSAATARTNLGLDNPVFNSVVCQPSTAVTACIGRVTAGGAEYGVEVQNKANNAHIAGIDGNGQYDGRFRTGTVLPATCTVGDLYFKSDATAGQNLYECQTLNTWTQQLNGGGGGSVFAGSTAVTSVFSATPTFSLADVSVKSPVLFQPGIMSANVTAVTFSNLTAGAQFSILWLQAATGGPFTVTYGTSVSSTFPACQVTTTASGWTLQSFKVEADGTTVIGTGCHSSDPGITLPGATSGSLNIIPAAVAGAGSKLTLPGGTTDFSATGGASQVVKQTSVGAALTVGQLAASDLSNGVSGTGAVCLATGSACGGAGWNPLDPTVVQFVEEFYPSNLGPTVGLNLFAIYNIVGTGSSFSTTIANPVSHPGTYEVVTSAASGDATGLRVMDGNSGPGNIYRLGTGGDFTSWEVNLIIRPDSSSIATSGFFVGFAENAAAAYGYAAADGIAVFYDTTSHVCSSGTSSTANFVYMVRAASVDTCLDSTIAVASNTWYKIRIASTTLGQVIFQISTNGGAYSAVQTLTTNVPTAAISPTFQVITREALAHHLDVDRWAITASGVAR